MADSLAAGGASRTEENSRFSPVFIVGHPRSGTTLLAACLDRNSRLAVTPETHFFSYINPRLPRRLGEDPAGLVRDLLTRTRLKDLGLESDNVLRRMRGSQPTHATLFRCMLEEYAGARGKPIAVEKSPTHIMALFTILRWYPQAKVIWIIRDGRDSIMSLLRLPWASNRLWILALQWRRNMASAFDFSNAHPDAIYRMHFEALLREPEAELIKLHAFLGVPFERSQLDPSRQTAVVPKWEAGWKGKSTQKIDPTHIQAWRQQADPRQVRLMNFLMGRELERLGYTDTEAGSRNPAMTWLSGLTNAGLAILFERRVYDALHRGYIALSSIGIRARKYLKRVWA